LNALLPASPVKAKAEGGEIGKPLKVTVGADPDPPQGANIRREFLVEVVSPGQYVRRCIRPDNGETEFSVPTDDIPAGKSHIVVARRIVTAASNVYIQTFRTVAAGTIEFKPAEAASK
jgi:hypothetical protein